MSFQLTEPIVTELVDRLRTDYAAAVAAINGAVTDGFTIEAPTDEHVLAYPPTPELLTVFPTLAVSDGPSKLEDDIGSSATSRNLLMITAYDQAPDNEQLTWRLRRHARAICDTVLDGRSLGSAAWGTGLDGAYPGPTFADNADPEAITSWMSWVSVRIWAKRDED